VAARPLTAIFIGCYINAVFVS